jgi:diguanylate cyclase (GGDEF)-like protein
MLFIDIDDFKEFNDRGGHATGDDVLGVVGRIIRHAVRDDDAVSRFGGDEYVVVLNGCTEDAIVTDVVARISSAVSFLQPLGAKSDLRVSLSIGRAALIAGAPISDALKLADADTYRVKAEHHARSGKVREQRKPA